MGSAPACHLSPHLPAEILLASASVEGEMKLAAGCLKFSMDIQLFWLPSASVPKSSSVFGAGLSKVYLLTNCPPRPAAQWDAHVGLARGGRGSCLWQRRTDVNVRIGQLSNELLFDERDRGRPGTRGLVDERGDEQAHDPDEANEEARLEHDASCNRHLSRALDLPGCIPGGSADGRARSCEQGGAYVAKDLTAKTQGLHGITLDRIGRTWFAGKLATCRVLGRACLGPGHAECPLLQPDAPPFAFIAPATCFGTTSPAIFLVRSLAKQARWMSALDERVDYS